MTITIKKHNIKTHSVLLAVFITGACSLIIEVAAVRVLAPYFGNTIFTVSSVISVILAALSLGYYFGGIWSDKHPTHSWFYGIILISGISVVAFQIFYEIALPFVSPINSIITGPLVSSILFFFFPAFLLGTLSPYAVRLYSDTLSKQGVGSIAGKVFFWSTLGSISGSLLAGFVLIPFIGIHNIFISVGIVLFLLGLFPLIIMKVSTKKLFTAYIIIAILVSVSIFLSQLNTNMVDTIVSKDGIYEKIIVYDDTYNDRKIRSLLLDKNSSSAMYLDTDDPTDLVYEYSKYYALYKIFQPEIKNTLVLGGGSYTLPKVFLKEFPKAIVDVSEIEPSLFDISKKYFNVSKNKRMNNYTEDGRRLLSGSDKKYDLIFGDAYLSLFSVPPHFVSREFFSMAKDHLNKNGLFMANIIGCLSYEKPSFVFSEIRTFKSVFPNSYFFAVDSPKTKDLQNIIFVGYKSNEIIDIHSDNIALNEDPLIRSLPDHEIHIDEKRLAQHPIFTDDYAPVEYFIAQNLK